MEKSNIKIPEVEVANYKVFISNVASIMDAKEMAETIIQCYKAYEDEERNVDDKVTMTPGDCEAQEMTPGLYKS